MDESDPILDELSRRCHQLLDTRILLAGHELPAPFNVYRLGRVRLVRYDGYLAVYLDRLNYRLTDDMVYAEDGGVHLSSHWPAIYDVLVILRMDMILDDLSAA